MAALDTVAKLVAEARVRLQDQVSPYRYADSELLTALNLAVFEARKKRPDLFLATFASLPDFAAVDTTAFPVDPMYRPAFLYYVCGSAHMRDEESPEDSRAAAFMGMFNSQLMTLA